MVESTHPPAVWGTKGEESKEEVEASSAAFNRKQQHTQQIDGCQSSASTNSEDGATGNASSPASSTGRFATTTTITAPTPATGATSTKPFALGDDGSFVQNGFQGVGPTSTVVVATNAAYPSGSGRQANRVIGVSAVLVCLVGFGSCFLSNPMDGFWVWVSAVLTALTTGLGALPFVLVGSGRRLPGYLAGLANAVACGMMLGASLTLLLEAGVPFPTPDGTEETEATPGASPGYPFALLFQFMGYDWSLAFLGFLGGVLLMAASKRLLGDHEISFENVAGADARRLLLVVGVMCLHSFAEGISIGVSFGRSQQLASAITASLAVHNIPEGLAISAVLAPQGFSVGRCAIYAIFSSLPQPLIALPAYLFVHTFRGMVPAGLGFAAGAMVWVTLVELLPAAQDELRSLALTVAVVAVGAIPMALLHDHL